MLTQVILVVGLVVLPLATSDHRCVAMRITDGYGRSVSVAAGPVTLVAEVRLQKRIEHRYIVVQWDYAERDASDASLPEPGMLDDVHIEPMDGAIGSEERSLSGIEQAIRNDFKMHNLEGGTFIVTATIYTDESRRRACGRTTARVVVH